MAAQPPPPEPQVTCWLLDTRSIWQGNKIQDAASSILDLISPQERDDVLRKYHIQDARMSLASALPVDFNVSHQAGIVALTGTTTPGLQLGIDVVWVNERNDYRTIDEEGFEEWVETYKEVFSAEEVWDMKYNADALRLPDGTEVTPEELGRNDRCCVRGKQLSVHLKSGETWTLSSNLLIDAKLRRFYTFWCYKEAYIKLTGEALLADWIPQLEFRNVRSPRAGTAAGSSTDGVWGERVDDAEVWFDGETLDDVRLEIQAFEQDCMVGVTAKPKEKLVAGKFPDFKIIDVERDILDIARA